jgi:hypothetical protein
MEPTDFVVECPHCKSPVLIEKLNCAIFRHGSLKSDGQQIAPHTSKELCDYYIEKNLINGCGKPFKVIKENNNSNYVAIVCEYI